MSDEPRDGKPDGATDPTDHVSEAASAGRPADDSPAPGTAPTDPPAAEAPSAGAAPADRNPVDPPAAEAPPAGAAPADRTPVDLPVIDSSIEDYRSDGSRTEVSAPWERPQRWQRAGLDADRVDALLARLGQPDDDARADDSTKRRNRRKNDDAVPASALIAALGPAAGGDATSAPDTSSGPRSEVDSNSGPSASDDAAEPQSTDPSALPRPPAGGHDAAGTRSGADDQDDGPHTDLLPKIGDNAAELAEASSIRAALERDGARARSVAAAAPPAAASGGTEADAATSPAQSGTAVGTAVGTAASSGAGSPGTETGSEWAENDPAVGRAGATDPAVATGPAVAAGAGAAAGAGTSAGAGTAAGEPVATGGSDTVGASGATLLHGSRRRRRHRGWLYAGRTIAALVAFTTLLGVGVEWKIKDRAEVVIQSHAVTAALNTTDPSISTARTTAVVRTNSQGVKTTMAAPPKTVYKPENILLLGSDTRAGANEAIGGADGEADNSQSDTLMVAHISGDRQHVTVLSVPRDTIIPAPTNCHSWDSKTNTYAKEVYQTDQGQTFHITNTYAVGGPQCIVSAVQSLTGLGINRLIGIDFKGFQAMVGALGGVTVNICKPIVDTVLGNVAPKGGVQVVDGQQALNLVRARHVIGDSESDLARIRRQQVVLSAILRQVTQAGTLLNPGRLDGFLQAFSKNTFTQNVKLEDLVTLAGSLGTLDPAHVTFYTLPTVPSTSVDGALDVDKPKAATVFDDLVNDLPLPGEVTTTAKPKPKPTATAAAPSTTNSLKLTVAPAKVSLELYNVSGRDNVAGMAQQELNAAGFAITDEQLFKPDRTQTGTVVQFAPANRAAALTVAAAVPGSTLSVIPGLGNTVHLQLGSSFAGVIKTVAVGQQAPASLSTAISTGASVAPSKTTAPTTSTGLSSVNAAAGTCA